MLRRCGLLLLGALACTGAHAGESAEPPPPEPPRHDYIEAAPPEFRAEYRILRNNGQIATIERHLRCDGDRCVYRQQGKTTGLARILTGGGELEERSTFLIAEQRLWPQRYYYRERLFGSESLTDVRFNHEAGTVSSDGAREWERELPDGALDELLAQLALGLALRRGERELGFDVLEKNGKTRTYHFRAHAPEQLRTPAGRLDTIRVEYIDPRRTDRTTEVWFATEHDYLPALIRQQRDDGVTWSYELTRIR